MVVVFLVPLTLPPIDMEPDVRGPPTIRFHVNWWDGKPTCQGYPQNIQTHSGHGCLVQIKDGVKKVNEQIEEKYLDFSAPC